MGHLHTIPKGEGIALIPHNNNNNQHVVVSQQPCRNNKGGGGPDEEAQQAARKRSWASWLSKHKSLCTTMAVVVFTFGFLTLTFALLAAPPSQHRSHAVSNNNNHEDISTPTTAAADDDDDDERVDPGTTTANNNKLMALSLASVNRSIPPGCESTVIIIRHCEKDEYDPLVSDGQDNQHCSYVGHQRAHYLPTLFGTSTSNQWPVPTVLYALAEERRSHYNYREVETLEPLAKAYNLPILTFDSNAAVAKDYFTKLAKGEMCNQVALISWKHSLIGDLANRELGCADCPMDYPQTFDEVWLIRYVYDVLRTPMLQHRNENYRQKNQHRHIMAVDASSLQAEEGVVVQQQQQQPAEEEEENHEPSLDSVKESDKSENQPQQQQRLLRGLRRKKHHYSINTIDDDETNEEDDTPPASALLNLRNSDHTVASTLQHATSVPRWSVYSTITAQHFDPLRFSNAMGDYVDRGAPGGKWWSSSTSSTTTSSTATAVVNKGEF